MNKQEIPIGMIIEQIRNSDWIRIEQIINKFHLLFE